MTIIQATDDAPALWMWVAPADALFGDGKVLIAPVIAFDVNEDGTSTPITPYGRAERGGAWVMAMNFRHFMTSDGVPMENQGAVQDWLRARAGQ